MTQKNFRQVNRGYQRSRQKEWAQAIMDEEFYDQQIESSCVAGGDPGVSALMAAAIEEEPLETYPGDELTEYEPAPERARPMDDGTKLSEPPFVAMHAIADADRIPGRVRRLWQKFTGRP